MAQGLPSRTFSTLAEFEDAAESATKEALINTLNHFKHKLRELATKHIYKNAYKAIWYKRTKWLEEDDSVEAYIYKNVKNKIGGGVRFNREAYDDFNEPFQHGNPVRYLPMNSYLEIMNNSSLLPSGDKNIFNFPTGNEIDRGHFYNDFLKLLDDPKEGYMAKFNENWKRAIHHKKTGRIDLRGYVPKNSPNISSGATSSSTRQYASLNSSNI